MKFRDINEGAKYATVDSDRQVDGETLARQDDEVHEAKVVDVADIDGDVTGQALAGYDEKGDCYAAKMFPERTVIVVCEVEQ